MTIISDAARAAAAAAAAREAARKAAEEAARKAAAEAAKKAAEAAAAVKAAAAAAKQKIAPRPSAPEQAKINTSTGRTSSFEAFKPRPVTLEHPAFAPVRDDARCDRDHGARSDAPSEGRGIGTNDDSVGRGTGTNDDSVGRGTGTNDDSVGRGNGTNDDSVGRGRGTNDDSVGRGRGTNDDSVGRGADPTRPGDGDAQVGSNEEPTQRGAALVPGRAGLSKETQAQMDKLTADHSDRANQSAIIFESPGFQKMPPEQRTQVVNVLANGGDKVGRAMESMINDNGGKMLTETGKDGVTVLSSLERLALSDHGKGVVGEVMYDMVNPSRIRQGRAPTCTVSSMQYELAHEAPGEYARLMAGLVCDGKVQMLGGGELSIDAKWAQEASEAAHDMRHASEAIFQAAAMEYANGKDTYLEYSQTSISADGGASYRGLHAEQITNMVGQLFGVDYKTKEINNNAEADAELQQILARERPSRPVLFDITIDGQQSNHLVSLEGVSGGYVYYRDPTTGERERMSVQDFREHLAAVHYAEFSTGFFDRVGHSIGAAVGAAVGGAKSVGSVAGGAVSSVGRAIGGAFSRLGGLF